MSKELLFSVTASDCDFTAMRGTGPGGQKRNKTESKVRCVHRASGAMGESDSTRSQHANKREAFRKMAESETFKRWHHIECSRRLGTLYDIDEQMKDKYLKVEGKVDGKWVPIEEAIFEENINDR